MPVPCRVPISSGKKQTTMTVPQPDAAQELLDEVAGFVAAVQAMLGEEL